MENYQKRAKAKRSRFDSDNDEPSSLQQQQQQQQSQAVGKGAGAPSHRHGVMHISAHGKIRTYVSRGLEVLQETEATTATNTTTEATTTSSSSIPPPSTLPSGASKEATPKNYSGSPGVLTIKAQGKNISKAVTIAEILKRRLEGSLHQFTEIGQVTEEEVWDPKEVSAASTSQKQQQASLDPIRLVRHRPTIRIRLSKHLDTRPPSRTDDNDDDASEVDDEEKEAMEQWPGAILDRDAAVRRLVGYQAPTGNDIYI